MQLARLVFLNHVWRKDRELIQWGFDSKQDKIATLLLNYQTDIKKQTNTQSLLQLEARMTKNLYQLANDCTQGTGFVRNHDGTDKANRFLNHGNYLAYGLGATTAWVLGIPHAFALMHGKTRRGALVFDIADLIKDALILPLSFICAKENASEQDFRQECLNYFTTYHALDFMFEVIKKLALDDANELFFIKNK